MTKRAYITILAAMSLALFPYAIATYNNMGEDAFISFRYVRNFVEGKGLVFNEGEWVEGYSNFSWVMLLAGAARLGGDILLWSKLLSVAAMAGMIWLAGLFFVDWRKDEDGTPAARINPLLLFAPLAIFFNTHLHYHAGRGLETIFYALAFLGCLFALARARWLAASLIFALLALTRPEGALHFAGFAVVMMLALGAAKHRLIRFLPNPPTMDWRSLVWLIAPGAAIIGMFIAWRLMTYGQLFPNTVYAKTSSINFLKNPAAPLVLEFIKMTCGLPLLAVVALLFTWKFNPHRWRTAVAVLGALAILFYIVFVGRVQAELFRHFIPQIAPMILILQAALLSMNRSNSPIIRRAVWPVFGLLLLFNFYTEFNGDHPASRLHARTAQFLMKWDWAARWEWYNHPPIHMYGEAGRWAEANLPPGALLAVDQMGQFGYYAPSHPIIDLLGLMDRHVAHNGLTWDYIARRDPDFVMVYAESEQPFLSNIREFTELPEFRERYRLEAILTTRYPEKITNQFLVYGRKKPVEPEHPPAVHAIGATAEEWEEYWRF